MEDCVVVLVVSADWFWTEVELEKVYCVLCVDTRFLHSNALVFIRFLLGFAGEDKTLHFFGT